MPNVASTCIINIDKVPRHLRRRLKNIPDEISMTALEQIAISHNEKKSGENEKRIFLNEKKEYQDRAMFEAFQGMASENEIEYSKSDLNVVYK